MKRKWSIARIREYEVQNVDFFIFWTTVAGEVCPCKESWAKFKWSVSTTPHVTLYFCLEALSVNVIRSLNHKKSTKLRRRYLSFMHCWLGCGKNAIFSRISLLFFFCVEISYKLQKFFLAKMEVIWPGHQTLQKSTTSVKSKKIKFFKMSRMIHQSTWNLMLIHFFSIL